jgi:hypothetical protein
VLRLLGYSRDAVVVVEPMSIEVLETHPLGKVSKWQMDGL